MGRCFSSPCCCICCLYGADDATVSSAVDDNPKLLSSLIQDARYSQQTKAEQTKIMTLIKQIARLQPALLSRQDDENGQTPVMTACWLQEEDVACELLRQTPVAVYNATDRQGRTLLFYAVRLPRVLALLLQLLANPPSAPDAQTQSLQLQLQERKTKDGQALDLGHRDASGQTVLSVALAQLHDDNTGWYWDRVSQDRLHLSIATLMLVPSVPLSADDVRLALRHRVLSPRLLDGDNALSADYISEDDGSTLLMLAIRAAGTDGRPSLAREAAADLALRILREYPEPRAQQYLNRADKRGETALICCARGQTYWPDVLDQLIENKADVLQQDRDGLTVLHHAMNQWPKMVHRLLDTGRFSGRQIYADRSLLTYAIDRKDWDAVSRLGESSSVVLQAAQAAAFQEQQEAEDERRRRQEQEEAERRSRQD